MKNLLLLGDSIRLGYQPKLTEMLAGEFDVWGPEENCRFVKYTLCSLNGWLSEYDKKPDVIHWNNGLWDTCVRHEEDGLFTTIEEYERDILKVLFQLRKLTDRIVFATTTPVDPKHSNQNNTVIDAYNAHIVKVLEKEGVIINDLNSLVKPHIDTYICEDLIHMTEAGQQACAKQVASVVRGFKF